MLGFERAIWISSSLDLLIDGRVDIALFQNSFDIFAASILVLLSLIKL